MEIIVTVCVLCGFGVYLTERLMLSKRQAVVLRDEVAGQLSDLRAQVDSQRERLNRVEARR